VSALAGIAAADNTQIELKELGEAMTLKAEPGHAVAKPEAPPWCDGVAVERNMSISALRRTIEDQQRTSTSSLVTAMPMTCRWPNEPAMQKAVAQILQYWINWTGLSRDKAVETLKLRLAKDRWASSPSPPSSRAPRTSSRTRSRARSDPSTSRPPCSSR